MSVEAAYMVPHPPLIVPAVGRGQERAVSATAEAYRMAAEEIALLRPDTIVVTSPHAVMYRDYFHISPGTGASGDFGQFRAAQEKIDVRYDAEFTARLESLAGRDGFPAGTCGERQKSLDHGTMVPLYFVNEQYKEYRLVRIGLSGLSLAGHYRLGGYIQKTAKRLGRKTVLLASGDLSHYLKEEGPYGYRKEGPEYDRMIMDIMGEGDFARLSDFSEEFLEKAGECGHRSFMIMAGALDGCAVEARRLSYEGPFGVGYGICSYHVTGRKAEEEEKESEGQDDLDAYVRLARQSLETYIRTGRQMKMPGGLPEEMTERRAGAFVSLKKGGALRGCIGTIDGVHSSLAEEIMENAVSAGVRDPRFPPVEKEELAELVYSVDVLGDTEEIQGPEELDVKRYGVIVSRGWRRGLLLPNLEGVDTVEEQIAIARQKAGIGEHEPVKLERFEVVRHR